MKQVAWITALILATAMVLIGLWVYVAVVVLFLLSLTLAAIVRPLIERLTMRGVPRSAAIGVTFTGAALGVVVLLFASVSLALPELERAARDVGTSYEYIHVHWPQGNALQRAIADRLPPLEKVPQSLADLRPSILLQNLLGISRGLFDFAVNILVIVVLSMYWSIDYHRFERLWMSLLPVEDRVRARELWRGIEYEIGLYMRSELLQSLAAAVVLGLLFSLIGFPYPIAVSILAALSWLVPWIGPALAIAAVWFAAFLGFAETTALTSLTRAFLGSTLVILVFLALEFVVEPRLIDRSRYSSLLIALVALALAELVGLVGLILGPPLAVAIQRILGEYLWQSVYEADDSPRTDVNSLAARLEDLRTRIDPEHAVPMANILSRVSVLLEDSRPLLPVRTTGDSAPLPDQNPSAAQTRQMEPHTAE